MKIQLDNADSKIIQSLFGQSDLPEFDKSATVANGISIRNRTLSGPAFGAGNQIVEFVITNATAVGFGILSNWLYDLLKSSVVRVRINGRAVPNTTDSIEKAVKDAIDKDAHP